MDRILRGYREEDGKQDGKINLSPYLNLPAKEQAEYSFILRKKPLFWDTVIAGTTSMDDSFAEVKDKQITSLGDIPLVVISSSVILELANTPELSVKADKALRELQREIAGQSSRGKHITAEGTTHFIQLVKPQAVIEAIQQVLQWLSK
ncbi:MAG: hypothetical protein WCP58_11300 [bacterium]